MSVVRPRLLLVDDDLTRRLEHTARLSATWDVQPVSHSDEPLRIARASRPDVIVLTAERKQTEAVLRLCRTLRTDVRPARRVGVIEATTRPRGAWIAMELWMADGWLGLPNDGEVVAAWVEALHRGERPNVPPRPAGGPLNRLKDLLRSR